MRSLATPVRLPPARWEEREVARKREREREMEMEMQDEREEARERRGKRERDARETAAARTHLNDMRCA